MVRDDHSRMLGTPPPLATLGGIKFGHAERRREAFIAATRRKSTWSAELEEKLDYNRDLRIQRFAVSAAEADAEADARKAEYVRFFRLLEMEALLGSVERPPSPSCFSAHNTALRLLGSGPATIEDLMSMSRITSVEWWLQNEYLSAADLLLREHRFGSLPVLLHVPMPAQKAVFGFGRRRDRSSHRDAPIAKPWLAGPDIKAADQVRLTVLEQVGTLLMQGETSLVDEMHIAVWEFDVYMSLRGCLSTRTWMEWSLLGPNELVARIGPTIPYDENFDDRPDNQAFLFDGNPWEISAHSVDEEPLQLSMERSSGNWFHETAETDRRRGTNCYYLPHLPLDGEDDENDEADELDAGWSPEAERSYADSHRSFNGQENRHDPWFDGEIDEDDPDWLTAASSFSEREDKWESEETS